MTQAIGLKYYGDPGIHVPPNVGFQYREPPEEKAWMPPEDYDALIADPTGYLFNTWLPRVSADVVAPGATNTMRNNLSFLKGGMAMLSYFSSFGEANRRLREECGVAPAIAGILKAPLDILGDKLRGFMGLCMDLMERRDKVIAACEAMMPHLYHTALAGADPNHEVPIAIWMHRGCVPLVSPDDFNDIYWPTLKPIILELWKQGHQVLFYAEGNWDYHLDAFAELPDGCIVYHVDRGDLLKAHRTLGHKFCLSGGISNVLLSYGKPEQVRARVKEVIEQVAGDGGYIMDASAIVMNDAKPENMRVLTEATREYGVY